MKVLLTGATGYIGRRLLPLLVKRGAQVVCLVRDRERLNLEEDLARNVEIFEADLLEEAQLQEFPKDIDVAYYLVHSMGSTHSGFLEKEKRAAQNFRNALDQTSAKQVIYLGGISNDAQLSPHLTSRKEVEEVLAQGKVPLTVLRAAIIIGSGSASFEIIRDLVEKLPLMVAPRWVNTRCQPLAVHNVMHYLAGVLLQEETYHQTYDIGGPDVLTYKEMLLQFAEVRGLNRYVLSVPVLSPRLSSYWLYFVTSTSYSLARSLVESMRNEVVVKDHRLEKLVPQRLIPYQEAVRRAFDKIAQNEVVSSWKDALASSNADFQVQQYVQIPTYGCFVDRTEKKFSVAPEKVVRNIWSIGGKRGWYYLGFLWKVRGWLDKLVGGVGLRRGRRSEEELLAGDALDFWRVLVADKRKRRLLLYAEMKLPGEAWLEFCVTTTKKGENCLLQTATFRPKGLAGRLYWYVLLPFHFFIFEGMAQRLIHYPAEAVNAPQQTPAPLI